MSFLGVAAWVMIFSDLTQVTKIEIVSEKVDLLRAREIIDSKRNQNFLKYFSRNNFFLFPRKGITESLQEDFETIRSVNFVNKFPDKIVIENEERRGILIWRNQGKIFLMDETGEIFREIQEGELNERFVGYDIIWDKSYAKARLGQIIEEGQLVDFIAVLKKELKEKVGLEIQREMETPSLISMDIQVKTEAGWGIYFDMESSLDSQIVLLRQILETNFSEEEKEKLEYIDLRISGKAIYKMSDDRGGEKNEEEQKDEEDE